MQITEVKDKNIILARYIPEQYAWREGLNFFQMIMSLFKQELGVIIKTKHF